MSENRPLDADEMLRWGLHHNLRYLVTFHNVVQELLREKREAPELQGEVRPKNVLELYEVLNTANMLLLALGHLEEMLILFWKRRMGTNRHPTGDGISRYKPLLDSLGVDVGRTPCWAVLQDAYRVRHCLLHANGRVSFMRESLSMRSCLARHTGALEERLDRLVVTPVFLQRCVVAIEDLRDAMSGGLTRA